MPVVRLLVAAGLVAASLVGSLLAHPAAAEAEPVRYRPPVQAPLLDGFQAPAQPWGAGNRGIDYDVAAGVDVRASADGVALFAGQAGGSLHVTLAHADGLRTSYSFLASLAVAEGAEVPAGHVLGSTGGPLHFGVRDGDGTYLDPLALLGGRRARLVPGGDDGAPLPPRSLGPLSGLATLRHYVVELHLGRVTTRFAADLTMRIHAREPCSAGDLALETPAQRRILVLVAGFGSTSASAGVDDVDAAALGYAPDDVLRFSYRGGRTPVGDSAAAEATPLAALPASWYEAADSRGDLPAAGGQLAELLGAVAAAEPGVPIDLVAHSQGGIVARLALDAADGAGVLPDELEALVTLGTPHRGADLATAAAGLPGSERLPVGDGPALAQLSETSQVIAQLAQRPLPEGVRFASVAARGDPVVAGPRTQVRGEVSTTVSLTGPGAHDELPGSAAATREIALARAGLPPTCRSVAAITTDVVIGHGIGLAQDAAGAGLHGALVPGRQGL